MWTIGRFQGPVLKIMFCHSMHAYYAWRPYEDILVVGQNLIWGVGFKRLCWQDHCILYNVRIGAPVHKYNARTEIPCCASLLMCECVWLNFVQSAWVGPWMLIWQQCKNDAGKYFWLLKSGSDYQNIIMKHDWKIFSKGSNSLHIWIYL